LLFDFNHDVSNVIGELIGSCASAEFQNPIRQSWFGRRQDIAIQFQEDRQTHCSRPFVAVHEELAFGYAMANDCRLECKISLFIVCLLFGTS
jgi:hypothetical protein